MILIITDVSDQSTCDVIDWLKYYHFDFELITTKDDIELIDLSPNGNFCFRLKNKVIKSGDIWQVWYRRGGVNFRQKKLPVFAGDKTVNLVFEKYLRLENTGILDFINYTFLPKSLNNQSYSTVNKMEVLHKALQVGLTIPNTLLTSCKSSLNDFLVKNDNKLITKAAIESLILNSQKYRFYAYTTPINNKLLNKYPENIPLSFFQKQIDKLFEIRTFMLDNRFYSMAIFSQQNSKTKLDFRHYDDEKPNRNVPFKLPKEIEKKLSNLMKSLNLNSGSIDLIYGKDKQFYFLEINPIGQFGMTSYPCNYYLEKKIALFLASKDRLKCNH
ncbi:MAG: grasp-with-spasm system ATP-grasp peptide maturase [Endomicrobium sp.]|jgi:ATP-GRASP peptide maturase of grasp-with-spasm system|nr:grasp-with-spasm system ATP-grasp peptide maturase [Endomicrobium sp.]